MTVTDWSVLCNTRRAQFAGVKIFHRNLALQRKFSQSPPVSSVSHAVTFPMLDGKLPLWTTATKAQALTMQ